MEAIKCHFDRINFVAVGVSAVVANLFSTLWYSDYLFGLQFKRELLKESTERPSGPTPLEFIPSLVGTFFTLLLRAVCIAKMMPYYVPDNKCSYFGAGICQAFLGFIGFILPCSLHNVFWLGQKWSTFGIMAGNDAISTLLTGAVIGYFGSK